MNAPLRLASATTALVMTLALSTPSFAAPAESEAQAPSQLVRFADLDLSTATGVHMLYRRIETAARQVCSEIVVSSNASSQIENLKCRQALVDAAVEQVNRPALTALHTGKRTRRLVVRR